MKFLPYECLKINSVLSRAEALKRLSNVITPASDSSLSKTGIRYRGRIEGSHFELVRITENIHRTYSDFILAPVIKGNVQSEISGCSVDMTMHPHPHIKTVWIFWVGSGLLFFLCFLFYLVSSLAEPNTDPTRVFIIGTMVSVGYMILVILGYAAFWGFFMMISSGPKKFFLELFEGREETEMGTDAPHSFVV